MIENAVTWDKVLAAVNAAGAEGVTNRQIATTISPPEASPYERMADVSALTRVMAKAGVIGVVKGKAIEGGYRYFPIQ